MRSKNVYKKILFLTFFSKMVSDMFTLAVVILTLLVLVEANVFVYMKVVQRLEAIEEHLYNALMLYLNYTNK